MVLEVKSRIVQSRSAYTQYLIIPSAIVRDSQYPLKKNQKVTITIDLTEKRLIIAPTKEALIMVK